MSKSRVEHKSFMEWQLEGRLVKRGSKARRFLVLDKTRLALFSKTQTIAIADMTDVARDELPNAKPKTVLYRYDKGRLYVSAQPSRPALVKMLQRNKFRWMPKLGRWSHDASNAQVEATLAAIKKLGYEPENEDELF
jgi:hypothetical protein